MKKLIYKSIIQVEILSETPISDQLSLAVSLADIVEEGDTGSFSIMGSNVSLNKELKGIRAVREMKKQGSDPEFFGMDDKGNEID